MEIVLIKKTNIEDTYGLVKDLAMDKFRLDQRPEIEVDHRGKPFFRNLDDVHFSISHSGEIWAVALDDKPIGFDIESTVAGRKNWLKLAERFFSQEEYEYVKKYGKQGFLRIWVRKEACLKLTGQGLSGGLNSFTVVKNMRLIRKVPMGYVAEVKLGRGLVGACCSSQNWTRAGVTVNKGGANDRG